MNLATEEAYGEQAFVCSELSGSMYRIADFLSENYRNKNRKGMKKVSVAIELEEEYKSILVGILKAIQPYYGMLGFRGRHEIGKH